MLLREKDVDDCEPVQEAIYRTQFDLASFYLENIRVKEARPKYSFVHLAPTSLKFKKIFLICTAAVPVATNETQT